MKHSTSTFAHSSVSSCKNNQQLGSAGGSKELGGDCVRQPRSRMSVLKLARSRPFFPHPLAPSKLTSGKSGRQSDSGACAKAVAPLRSWACVLHSGSRRSSTTVLVTALDRHFAAHLQLWEAFPEQGMRTHTGHHVAKYAVRDGKFFQIWVAIRAWAFVGRHTETN